MRWQALCALAREWPEVVEDAWYGTPALKVRGKGFVRLKEDGRSVVFVLESVDEQEFLVEAEPDVYYITDHYRGWPAVLARLSALTARAARQRLDRGWRLKAPRALIASVDVAASSRATPAAKRSAKRSAMKTPASTKKPAKKPLRAR